MPDPDRDHIYWHDFVALFDNLLTPADVIMFQAFVASPLYHRDSVPKPFWVIDSAQGQGVGKSKMVDFVARLYGSPRFPGSPIKTTLTELRDKPEELNKRLLSDTGRQSRIVLLDNATGVVRSDFLASLITASYISGRRSYGKGEESRPNNLTYVVTVNSATFDTDLTHRAFFITLKRPVYNTEFDSMVVQYIDKYRLNIIADLIDILNTAPRHPSIAPVTRCAKFEADILQAFCPTIEDYESIHDLIQSQKSESNVEEDWARRIEEAVRFKLIDMMLQSEPAVFIRSEVIRSWIIEAIPELKNMKADVLYQVTAMAKSGLLKSVHLTIRRYPYNNKERRQGLMWMQDVDEFLRLKSMRMIRPPSVGVGKDGKPSVIHHTEAIQ